MPNLNKTLLMGTLTKDLELKYVKNGQPVTNMRLAVTRTYTSLTGEEKKEICFITVVVWGKQAESCHTYLKKDSLVFVEGRLQSRSWEGEGGEKRSVIEVVAERVQFMDRKKKADEAEDLPSDKPGNDTGGGGADEVPF